MDGDSNDNMDDPAPPPPLPLPRRPSDSSHNNLSPPNPSSRGPSRGLSRGRSVRERRNSSSSQDLQDLRSVLQRKNSVYNRPQLIGEQQGTAVAQPLITSDARLIIASLDHEAVEDEAEATLLEVLERRQVAFDTHDRAGSTSHRRNCTFHLPSIDLLDLGSTSMHMPAAAPSSSAGAQPSLRSSLQSRSRSNRWLGQDQQPSMMGGQQLTTSEFTNDEEGIEINTRTNQASSQDGAERANQFRPHLQAAPSFSNRGNRHIHVKPALPLGLEGGISDSSSAPTGVRTPWERARLVALKIKTTAANNMEDASCSIGEGELPGFVNIMEAHRDNDNQSTESAHEGGGRDSKGSKGNTNGRVSYDLENHSKGGTSGTSGNGNKGHRTQRPFSEIFSSPFSSDGHVSEVENLLRAAETLQGLNQIPEEQEGDLEVSDFNFLSQVAASHPDIPPTQPEEYIEDDAVGADEQTPMINQDYVRPRPSPRMGLNHMWPSPHLSSDSRFHIICLWWLDLRQQMKIFAAVFDPPFVRERIWFFCQNDISLIIVPALAASAFFYYSLNNPTLMILSSHASVSWWILFAVRHYLTLQLAYITQYVLVDVLAMRTRVSTQLIGPLATLCAITSKGWPYIISWWSLFNSMFIREKHDSHGDTTAYDNRLYFTGIEMFTSENPSGGVVRSETYGRILVSMVVAGVATSLKRTVMALFLGKRIYVHYQPKLQKVMESMVLMNEVSEMGEAIDDFEFEKIDHLTEPDQMGSNTSRRSTRESIQLRDKIRTSTMNDVIQKSKVETLEPDSDEEESGGEQEESKGVIESTRWIRLCAGSDSSGEIESSKKTSSQEALDKFVVGFNDDQKIASLSATQGDLPDDELLAMDNSEPPIATVHEPAEDLLRNKSTTTRIRSLLDEWEEPVNKQDKMADPTFQEILTFRKALSFLEDTHPFGSSFGPASTRDLCIKSSKSLYKRLLSLSPGSTVLDFDIIAVLAYNIDGTFDAKKAKSLVRLFRPDKFDEVSLLHFVQSCDGIYKNIRYLRASVGNSTLIDSVLENIFNGVFSFFLSLAVMSVLHLNPWALLVSLSTVLVSFAFALGPSAAKLIEGMIMIAVRRPFDLGDRISIVDYTGAPDNSGDPGYHDTWLVEDVSLFTTTLRLSRSNEISTVNNGAIANTRIVNHGRSQKALVNISLLMNIDVAHEKVQIVQSALEQYIRDNPRVWSALINFRITKIDPANELIVYSARIQHVKSWQDLLPILQARGDLEKFCTEILIKLDIHYDGTSTMNDVYIKQLPGQQIFPQVAACSVPLESTDQHYG